MSMQIELGIVAPEGLLTSTSSWPLVGKGGLPDRGAEIWDPRVQPESWGEGRLKDPGSRNLFFQTRPSQVSAEGPNTSSAAQGP